MDQTVFETSEWQELTKTVGGGAARVLRIVVPAVRSFAQKHPELFALACVLGSACLVWRVLVSFVRAVKRMLWLLLIVLIVALALRGPEQVLTHDLAAITAYYVQNRSLINGSVKRVLALVTAGLQAQVKVLWTWSQRTWQDISAANHSPKSLKDRTKRAYSHTRR